MSLVAAPVLESENLILRGPIASDAEPVIAFLMDRPRSDGFGGSDTRSDAWRWFTVNLGHWLLRGYGYFTIELKDSGLPAGLCGIWNPEGWPEPEIGWVTFAGFEGRSIAYEAALRVRRYAYDDLGLTTLTSNIVPGNTRSAKLAERLGARYERTYTNVAMGEDDLFRHPGPDEVLG
ncbi:GNAT family N-acetyltransferase [Salipiger sp. 1_MG-2023]|uniref:GNAT family N-acetyltransferase n=1 Tax=Salipiger sp. 1_MG-2023 TaxID=3062665 RepID=UPI0026E46E27|nr:GNAT family N-acetyltransferase [Salipiger sp. 1_MG-2023]MDO6586013.1 GNAT family N-acetyltransferase [Salipiger sp. 1_MG-2023]